ncbi:MAG: response regulator transcription factor [Chloroflexota bacterium]
MSISLLIIEDDEIVARTIERSLRGQEFKLTTINSGVDGLKTARRAVPDMVILDIVMPGMDGYTVCREMRADPLLANVPILFLTAKIKDEDKIAGFIAGADDYLTKPFNVDELILRVRAILRRTKVQSQAHLANASEGETKPFEDAAKITIGPYTLDTRSYELTTPHRGKLRLTPVQYDLLYHLMSHPGRIFSPARLLDEVWDYPANTGSPDLVRVHIKNLRERIEEEPSTPTFIRTVPGYGYTVGTG